MKNNLLPKILLSASIGNVICAFFGYQLLYNDPNTTYWMYYLVGTAIICGFIYSTLSDKLTNRETLDTILKTGISTPFFAVVIGLVKNNYQVMFMAAGLIGISYLIKLLIDEMYLKRSGSSA